MKYFLLAFKNWNKFNGRSNRPEFWYLTIVMTLYILYLNILKGTDGDNKYGSPSTL